MNIFSWISRIVNMKSVFESVFELLRNIAGELEKMENKAGGALQPELRQMRTSLMASADQLAVAVATNTPADQEAKDHAANTETSEQVLERQKAGVSAPPKAAMPDDAGFVQSSPGAAQQAADSLKAQDDKSPDKSGKKK